MIKHDCFIGCEPPFLLFETQFNSLFHVVESHKADVGNGPLQYPANPASEIAFIGLVALFEAFCKHQLAALISLDPHLLTRFAENRQQAFLSLGDVALIASGSVANIGPVVAEQYDFGSGKAINGLFRDLVSKTPFSKDECRTFEQLHLERNLLVHHGGVYTLHWIRKRPSHGTSSESDLFRDRLFFSTEQYHERGDFLFQMAMKVTRVTVNAARELVSEDEKSDIDESGYTRMLEGLHDSLE